MRIASKFPLLVVFLSSVYSTVLPRSQRMREHYNTSIHKMRQACESGIVSPARGEVWTAVYLIIEWKSCGIEHTRVEVLLDGRVVGRGMFEHHQKLTVYGVADGHHTVRVNLLEAEDLSESFDSPFTVQRGQSLLGRMQQYVNSADSDSTVSRDNDDDDSTVSRDNNDDDSTVSRDDDDRSKVGCGADDVTFVTAAIDIGRRHGDVTFENDYIGNLKHILRLHCKVVMHIQQQSRHLLQGHLHAHAQLRFKELEDLRNFPHFEDVERLRTSALWLGYNKSYNPAKMPLYNALVMSKLYWLAEVAAENPFSTHYFLWIDAGLCVRFVSPPLRIPTLEHDRFLVYSMHHDYADEGADVHGFPQHGHERYGGGSPRVLLRGNILGGSSDAIRRTLKEFNTVLQLTLHDGFMGTEESALTLVCARDRSLCEVMSVSDNHLRTEMPCSMFLQISSTGPQIMLTDLSSSSRTSASDPSQGFDAATMPQHLPNPASFPPEGFATCTLVRNFPTPTEGTVCVSWEQRDGASETWGRACGVEECIVLVDLPLGTIRVRGELLGLDGLPVASSAPTEILIEPATSDSMDMDNVLDSRADLASLIAQRGTGHGVVIVGGGCEVFQEELRGAGYVGAISTAEWGSTYVLSAHARDDAAVDGTTAVCESRDAVYLCVPVLHTCAGLRNEIEKGGAIVARQGLLSGSSYFSIHVPGEGPVHCVQDVVDTYARERQRRVQITQEMSFRSWSLW